MSRPIGSGGSYQDRTPERTLDQLWPGYLRDGYFDAEGCLRLDYVRREKVEPLIREMAQRARPKLTSNQLRRFFSHCRAIEAELRAKTASWETKRADFAMLDVAAADAFGKEQKKIPKLFHDFIRQNVAAVRNQKDFLEGFLRHF